MATSGGQLFYCYKCDRNVRPPGGSEIACPNCGEGFLEEVESAPDPPPAPMSPFTFMEGTDSPPLAFMRGLARSRVGTAPNTSPIMEALSAFFQHMQTAQLQQNPDGSGRPRPGPGPSVVLQSQIPNIPLGGNIEIFFDNGTGDGARRLPGNFGDYFWGPGLDQLIQQLAENDPNRYGAPPASKSAVEAMPTITISEQQLGTDAAHCAVCKDAFELGSEARQMPCSHLYHSDCILPWLAQHNSCPVCRYEMPTDDPEYDQARARGSASAGSAGAGGPGGFTFWGVPGQFNTGQFPGGAEGWTETGGQQAPQSGAPPSGTTQGTRAPGGSRFSILPWFRNGTAVSQSAANAQAGSSSQANSAETVSSGPAGEGVDTPGQTSRRLGADDDGDRVMTEARQEDLD
ncbi:hypothetical protein L7F22_001351 [Adiantum nelumboides]|nr:hypothetical protein [Adiantum nelumboides]